MRPAQTRQSPDDNMEAVGHYNHTTRRFEERQHMDHSQHVRLDDGRCTLWVKPENVPKAQAQLDAIAKRTYRHAKASRNLPYHKVDAAWAARENVLIEPNEDYVGDLT